MSLLWKGVSMCFPYQAPLFSPNAAGTTEFRKRSLLV